MSDETLWIIPWGSSLEDWISFEAWIGCGGDLTYSEWREVRTAEYENIGIGLLRPA